MYALAFFWSVRWIYTDSELTATIHSRYSWGFLPQVAQAKTKKKTKAVSGLIMRVACAASTILSFTIWAVTQLIFMSFLRNILSLNTYSPLLFFCLIMDSYPYST